MQQYSILKRNSFILRIKPVIYSIFLAIFVVVVFSFSGCKKEESKDNKLPWIEIVQPYPNYYLASGDSIEIIAEAGDVDGTVQNVNFFVNNQFANSDNTPPYTLSFNEIPEGSYSIMARAVDNDNGVSTSEAVKIYATNSAEEISISVDFNKDSIFVNHKTVFNVHASSTDCKIKRIEFYLGSHLFAFSNDSSLVYEWIPQNSCNYNLKIKVIDTKDRAGFYYDYFSVHSQLFPEIQINSDYNGIYGLPGLEMAITVKASISYSLKIGLLKLYLNDSLLTQRISSDTLTYKIHKFPMGTQTLKAVAYSNIGDSTVKTQVFHFKNAINVNGLIKSIIPTDEPEKVYAIDETNNRLLNINPKSYKITNTIELPETDPYAADYSFNKKRLYIVSKYSGNLTIWDENTSQTETVFFSEFADGRDIKVDELQNKLFVATTSGLYIFNSNNNSLIIELPNINSSKIELIPEKHLMFTVENNVVKKYSIVNAEPELIQSTNYQFDNVIASPDNDLVALGSIFALKITKADDINYDYFILDFSYKGLCFNNDGSLIYAGVYGYNSKEYSINVYDTKFFYLQKQYELFNLNNESIVALNNDNSNIIAFTYNNYYNSSYYLYFFENL